MEEFLKEVSEIGVAQRIADPEDAENVDGTAAQLYTSNYTTKLANNEIFGAKYAGRTVSSGEVFQNRDEKEDEQEYNDMESGQESEIDSGEESGGTDEVVEENDTGTTVDLMFPKEDRGNSAELVLGELKLADILIGARIKLQGALKVANQLPRGVSDWEAVQRPEHEELLATGRAKVDAILQRLLAIQEKICPVVKKRENEDEEISSSDDEKQEGNSELGNETSPTTKRCIFPTQNFLSELEKRHENVTALRDEVLKRCQEQTKLRSVGGKNAQNSANFDSFDTDVVTVIRKILSDKRRLIARTQTKRSDYGRLKPKSGTRNPDFQDDSLQDPEIFDDDDFYHKLLKELIERKANSANVESLDSVSLTRQWLEIEKLRKRQKKRRKNVDTKASKGRRLRYTVEKKLVSFMAPVQNGTFSDETKEDLFACLFA